MGILSAQQLNEKALADLLEMEGVDSLDNVEYVIRIENRLKDLGLPLPRKLNTLLSFCSINGITERVLFDTLATAPNGGFLSKENETLAKIDSASLTHTMIIKEAITQFFSDPKSFGDDPDLSSYPFHKHFWEESEPIDPPFRNQYLTPPNLYFLIWLSLLTFGFLFLLFRPKKKKKDLPDSVPSDKDKSEEEHALGAYSTLETAFNKRIEELEKAVGKLDISTKNPETPKRTETRTEPPKIPVKLAPPAKPKVQYYAQTPNKNGVFFKIKKTHDPGITYFLITEISPDQASVSFIDDIQVKKAALNYFDNTITPVFEVKNSVSPAEADASNIVVVKEARVKKEGDNWKIIEKGIIEF